MKNERFEQYFLQYKNLVIRMVMNKTGDYQVAQEICQHVFVSLYSNMDRVAPDLVKAWLMRCTQNAIVDYIRRSKIREEVFLDMSVVENGSILAEEVLNVHEEKLDNQELAGKILQTVKAANEQWYEVLMMYCIDGLTYPEIAQKLNIPVPVLRARLYRARMYVREKFGNEYRKR